MGERRIGLLFLCAGACLGGGARAGDFADVLVSYDPAPGQFINQAIFNDPTRALGAPVGGGTATPDNSKLVSLGGFGGSITLGFSETVRDDPCNPYGLDAIVFGNALWLGGNANRKWCEAGVIEISRDVNGNGIADDPWYVIPGTHLPPNGGSGAPAEHALTQEWDNSAGTPTPPANVGWYPSPGFHPGFPSSYATTGYRLPALFDAQFITNPNGLTSTTEGYSGYADASPTLILGDMDGDNVVDDPLVTAEQFYTRPDNPYVVGVTPGSAGGDAFDIAWAVDPATGAPAELDGFDFIRISTGAHFIAGVLGEVSTEIGGVARVRAEEAFFDRTGDGAADVEDLYAWERSRDDVDGDGAIDERDRRMLVRCVRRAERKAQDL